ncbi:MAG: TonB-dependent receptor [Gallionellales bacterium GWA2_60_142]|nr:MAG: TonB-dependent receptor [Gallionellales bacterium GWA2_60_142]HCI13693.1 TonB-dependent receptor [Gallionellaceae bacterium]
MKYRRQLLFALPLLLQAHLVFAETDEENELALIYGSRPLVSIASGSDLALNRAPAVASVITAEDIKSMGAKDMDEVLETVPGIHVSRSAINYASVYQIRGISNNSTNPQALMLQNGIPTNSIYRGDKGKSWGGLSLENVARIEIIRGPGSALYGADAFSGVINIITKTAANAPGTEFGVRAGSFNSKDAWIHHGGKLNEAVDIAAYLHIGRTDGFKEIVSVDAATRLDNIFNTNASLAPGPVNTGFDAVDAHVDFGYEKWRLRGDYKQRSNVGTGAGISSALDPVGKDNNERISADLTWKDPQFSQYWGLGFTGSYLNHAEVADNYNMYPPGTRLPTGLFPNGMIGSPARWERQTRISGYATYSGFTDHSLRFGAGHEDLDLYRVRTVKNFLLNATGVPIPTGPVIDYGTIQPHQLPHRRLNNYLYAQDEWNFARDWMLTAGLRHDQYSDFGGTTNPRLAVVWDAAYNLTAKLLYGKAFRAPALLEQYGVNPSGNGNPNLKPETIETMEAAIAWQATLNTQVNLNLFRYKIKDTIRTVANATAGTGSTFQNTGAQRGDGMELEAVWDASGKLRLTGNYAWQRSIDEVTNQDASYAPRHHINLRGDWQLASGWLLAPQVNWVADRKRPSGDTRPQVPDYTTVDLTLRTSRSMKQWNFSASVRNLFDATVLEPSAAPGTALPNDLPMAPRSLWLQADYKL